MTLEELNGWAKYIDINGPLSPILRNDAAVARLSMVMAGKGAKMENFMPWPKRPEPEMDQMNVFKKLQALAAHNRTH